MAHTGLQMNWGAVGFTPLSGTLLSFTKVDSVSFELGGQLLTYSGDLNIFPTVKVNNMNEPKASLKTSNPGQIMNLVTGTIGSFTATSKDAKGVSTGDIVYVLSNAVIGSPSTDGGHAAFQTATLPFESFSTDGVTSPLAYAPQT